MSTTEQKALYADRNPRKLEPHYTAHVMAMTREDLYSKSDFAAELAWRDQQIEALRAQVEALTIENQALWNDRGTLQNQRDAFLEAGLRDRYLLVRDRDAVDEAHTGADGEIDADGARAVAEFNAVIAHIDSAVEGAKKVHPTPSPLTRPAVPEGWAHREWRAAFQEAIDTMETEIETREDPDNVRRMKRASTVLKSMLAAAPQPEVQATEAAQPADNPSEDYKQGWMDGMSEATRLSAPVVTAKDALGLLAIEDDAIVLRLTADAAASSFANDPKAEADRPAVTDKQQFLRDVFNALASEREDGSTRLTDVLDWAEREAWEQGSLGLAAQKGGA